VNDDVNNALSAVNVAKTIIGFAEVDEENMEAATHAGRADDSCR
jgi:hypothetical protein